MAEQENPSSNVQSLIERIRDEGVEAGEEKAKQIVDEAHKKAASIVEQAHKEADHKREEANQEIHREREAGQAALQQAARDTLLRLKEELTTSFAKQLQREVADRLDDPAFLERLILEVAGQSRVEEGKADVLLPDRAIDLETLRDERPELDEDPLTRFAHRLAREGLAEGVEVKAGEHSSAGIKIRMADEHVEVELTEEALTEALSKHLLPRFRGLLEGLFR